MYTVKAIAATDTTAEKYQVTFDSEYVNPFAQAASTSKGLAAAFRGALEDSFTNGLIAEECIFSNVDLIVEGWEEIERNDDKETLASYKASLATQSRKMFGFGCKVQNSNLVGTKVGAGKGAANTDSIAVKTLKAFESGASEAQKKEMLKLIDGAIALYKKAEAGATIK